MSNPVNPTTIYVALLDEGVDVWRPVEAERLASGLFRILSEREDPDEIWEFFSGSIVKCESRRFDSQLVLVAVAIETTPHN